MSKPFRHTSDLLTIGACLALLLLLVTGLAGQPVPITPAPILANTRSGIYHWPGCPNYPAQPGPHWQAYPSREAAAQAGHRAAQNCRKILPSDVRK